MTYNDITLEQSISINELLNSDLSDLQKIEGLLMVIYDIDLNTKPITELGELSSKLSFLSCPIPDIDIKEQYEVDG